MSWFKITSKETGKVLATNIKGYSSKGDHVRTRSGAIDIEDIQPDTQVISSDEIYIDPDFEKSWSNFIKTEQQKALKEECDKKGDKDK